MHARMSRELRHVQSNKQPLRGDDLAPDGARLVHNVAAREFHTPRVQYTADGLNAAWHATYMHVHIHVCTHV